MSDTPQLFVYVLKCEEGKIYVGRTTRIAMRLFEHWEGIGSQWTRTYPPICVLRIIETTSTYDEGNYVKEYMHTHGIDNVRGGAYVTHTLSVEQKTLITKEIREAKNLCLLCGASNHFCNNCPNKTQRGSPRPHRHGSPRPTASERSPRRGSPQPVTHKRVGNMHRSPSPNRMAGNAWTNDEEARLLEEYANGLDVETLATYHERTQNAIRMKLGGLGVDV